MRINNIKIAALFLILGIFIFVNGPVLAKEVIQVVLVYPQKSNAPKRETKKADKPAIVRGEVSIDVAGVTPAQLKNPDIYVEYFLDEKLIYSNENKTKDKTKPVSFGFILDSRLYPDGKHNLVVNFWDKGGPSAIGIRKIIIQNRVEK